MTTILLVDDDDMLRKLLGDLIRTQDFDCIEAKDGVDALIKFGETFIDLVLTDHTMPNMGGIELIQEIRKFSEVPIIHYSGFLEKQTIALQNGATFAVTKPLSAQELLKVMQQALA